MDLKQRKTRIFYLCDGEKEDCKKKSCYKNMCYKYADDPEMVCRRTADIRHAKNFSQAFKGVPCAAYREQETAPICGAVRKIMRSWIKMKEYKSSTSLKAIKWMPAIFSTLAIILSMISMLLK